MTKIQSTSLYFNKGGCSKEYHAAIESKSGGYIVTFACSRRGSALTFGSKPRQPVSLIAATQIHQQIVTSKLAMGYRYGIWGYQPATQSGKRSRRLNR